MNHIRSILVISAVLATQGLFGATFLVTDYTDTHGPVGLITIPGADGVSSASGDLRGALNYFNTVTDSANSISYNQLTSGQSRTVTLSSMLPVVNLFTPAALTFSTATGSIIIDGNSQYRGIVARQGSVNFTRVGFQNCVAHGGDGGSFGGGGGMGAGGAIFSDAADITLFGTSFTNCSAVGGTGGAGAVSALNGGGGGGGMGGNGGSGGTASAGGGATGGGGGGGIGNYGVDGIGGNGGANSGALCGGGGGGGGINSHGAAGSDATVSTNGSGGGGGGIYANGGAGQTNSAGSNGATITLGTTGVAYGGGGGGTSNFAAQGGTGGAGACMPLTNALFGGSGGGSQDCPITGTGWYGGAGVDTAGGGGGGGANALVASVSTSGGAGAIGGGGGGGGVNLAGGAANVYGGNGGWGGGAGGHGAASSSVVLTPTGGFGGGGGGSSLQTQGSNGGFGGGGGGNNATSLSPAGGSGFGGGSGGAFTDTGYNTTSGIGGGFGYNGGGGGAGLGGAVFVNSGTLNIAASSTFSGNSTTAGAAGAGTAGAGASAGGDIFSNTGSIVLQLHPRFGSVTLTSPIADSSLYSINGAGFTPGSGSGVSVLLQADLSNGPSQEITLPAGSTYSGGTTLAHVSVLGITAPTVFGNPASQINLTGSFNILTVENDVVFPQNFVLASVNNTGLTVDTNGHTVTLSGNISSGGSLIKQGAGTLILTGTSTNRGRLGTEIDQGTVSLQGTGILSPINSVNLLASGTEFDISLSMVSPQIIGDLTGVAGSIVNLGANTLKFGTATASAEFSGTIQGTGGIIKQGSGTVVLDGSSTYSGGTTLLAGTLNINTNAALGNAAGTVTVNGASTLQLAATISDMDRAMTLNDTLTVDTNGFDLTEAGIISGASGLVKTGVGSLILTGGNLYSGGTSIQEGTLSISNGGSLDATGSVDILADATFDISSSAGNQTIGDLTGDGMIDLGSNTLLFGTSNSRTFAGNVSGTGFFEKQGSGTVTLTGISTYTGGTILADGTLVITRNKALGDPAASLHVTGNATLEIDANLLNMTHPIIIDPAVTLTIDTNGHLMRDSGVISGGGALTKQGAGRLILRNTANTYAGPTDIVQGTLALVNSSLTGNVNVQSGATLKGTGSISGTVTSTGGTIRPGNSVGTISIGGNLTLDSFSTVQIEVMANGKNSLLAVAGTATLGTAELQILVDPGLYIEGTSYTILTAHPRSGMFNPTVTYVSPIGQQLVAQVLYFPTSVVLSLNGPQPCVTINAGLIDNSNGVAVVDYLNQFACDPILAPTIIDLAMLDQGALNAAINSVSPARNAISTFMAQNTMFLIGRTPCCRMSQYRLSMGDDSLRLGAMPAEVFQGISAEAASSAFLASKTLVARGASSSLDYTGRASVEHEMAYQDSNESSSNASSPYGSAETYAQGTDKYAFWVEGLGEFIHQNAQTQNPGYSSTAGGGLLGFDYYGVDKGMVGASVGYVREWIDETGHAGNATIDFYAAHLYGTAYCGDGYLEWGLAGAVNRFNNTRNVQFPAYDHRSHSEYWGGQIAPHLSGGYDFNFDWGCIEPFASLDCAVLFQPHFSEHGSGVLNMYQESSVATLLRSEAGIHAYEIWNTQYGDFILRETLSYVNKEPFRVGLIKAGIVGFQPGFTVDSFTNNQNFISPGFQFFYKACNGAFCSILYMGEFQIGPGRYISNNLLGKLGVYF